jgi:hypothetical protein
MKTAIAGAPATYIPAIFRAVTPLLITHATSYQSTSLSVYTSSSSHDHAGYQLYHTNPTPYAKPSGLNPYDDAIRSSSCSIEQQILSS